MSKSLESEESTIPTEEAARNTGMPGGGSFRLLRILDLLDLGPRTHLLEPTRFGAHGKSCTEGMALNR
jgi:hypothetical protein